MTLSKLTKSFFGLAVAFGFAAMALAAPVRAAEPKLLSEHTDWAVYAFDDAGLGKVCFAVTQPTAWEPKNLRRDPIFFLVTNWQKTRVSQEVSVITGYPYKKGSTTRVRIGSDTFSLFTSDDGAWVERAADEKRLITAMRRGASMTVSGTSWRGNVTTDEYSLKGVSAALDAARSACK